MYMSCIYTGYLSLLSLPKDDNYDRVSKNWTDRDMYIPYKPYYLGGGQKIINSSISIYDSSYVYMYSNKSFSVVTNNKRVGGFAEIYVLLQGTLTHTHIYIYIYIYIHTYMLTYMCT